MDTTCAVVRLNDGLVLNTIFASASDLAPAGCTLIEIMTGQSCGIGWYYDNNTFNGPKTFAMCDSTNNEVVSFFSVSHISPVPIAPVGYFDIEITTDCGIGWTWDGSQFNPPVA